MKSVLLNKNRYQNNLYGNEFALSNIINTYSKLIISENFQKINKLSSKGLKTNNGRKTLIRDIDICKILIEHIIIIIILLINDIAIIIYKVILAKMKTNFLF